MNLIVWEVFLKVEFLPVRNHYSGQGKGGEKIVIEDYLARYALNITGSCIVFLIEISGL